MGNVQAWTEGDFPRLACDQAPACGCTKEAPLTHRSAEVAESGEAVVTSIQRKPPGLKDSIAERPCHSNFSDHNSVTILSEFRKILRIPQRF